MISMAIKTLSLISLALIIFVGIWWHELSEPSSGEGFAQQASPASIPNEKMPREEALPPGDEVPIDEADNLPSGLLYVVEEGSSGSVQDEVLPREASIDEQIALLASFDPLIAIAEKKKEHTEAPAKEAEPAGWQTRLEYARVLSYLKRYEESMDEYQKVLKEQPDLASAKLELAKVYYYAGDYQQALDLLKQLPSEAKDSSVDQLMGDIYLTKKEYAEAETLYRSVLAHNPDDDAIWLKLADMYSWQKRYQESLAIFKKLVDKHPKDLQLRRKYAMVLIWSGRDAEGAEELKKTLS